MKYRALLAIAFVVTIHQPVQMQHETPLSYSIEDFYSNTQFRDASFSPDGKTILVSSDLSGIWNAYAVPVEGGAAQPLTQSRGNAVFTLSYFPRDERILYRSDEGGNELTHIYARHPDGAIVDVTPGGVAVEYVVFSDEGHGFVKKENEIKGYGAVIAFLNTHLKK